MAPITLLVLVCAIDFAAMPAMWYAGDPTAWREETRSILRDKALHVDAKIAKESGEYGQYFVFNPHKGWRYSKYGVMNSVMALPPMALEFMLKGRVPRTGEESLLIFNLYNIVLSLATCALLYGITGWYTRRVWVRAVYVLSICYATYFWYYQRAQSSEVYQVLFFTAVFYLRRVYLGGLQSTQARPSWNHRLALLAAWVFVTALVLTRVLFLLLVPMIWLAVVCAAWELDEDQRGRMLLRQSAYLFLPVALIAAGLAWINQVKFGSPWLTGYHQWRPREHLPIGRWQDGIWGVLFDPQGSMLLHFPVIMFALLVLREFYRRYKLDTVILFLLPAALFLFLTKTPVWRGEWAYGPRLVIFMLPVLALPFVLYLEWLADAPRRWGKIVMVGVTTWALGYSTFLQYQANRLDFWTPYQISETVEGAWSREMARYFLEHQAGVFNQDLIRHRDDLDSLPFVADLEKRGILGQRLPQYKTMLRNVADEENFYWKRSRSGPTPPASGQ
jgi:hypothetical protein